MYTNKKTEQSTPASNRKGTAKASPSFEDNRPEMLQMKAFEKLADQHSMPLEKAIQQKANKTGLPHQLKSGIEQLSGYSMDDVKVHYNSSKPTQLQAHTYAKGSEIYLASGQEEHLAHEAWHVVQQKQGRVNPTLQLKGGVAINDNQNLEKEADLMGAKANSLSATTQLKATPTPLQNSTVQRAKVTQLLLRTDLTDGSKKIGLVGERHGDHDETEEKAIWNKVNIKLFYENESIPVSGTANKITPDPHELRILFTWENLKTQMQNVQITDHYTQKYVEDRKDSMKEGSGLLWGINYLTQVLVNNLEEICEKEDAHRSFYVAKFSALTFKDWVRRVIRQEQLGTPNSSTSPQVHISVKEANEHIALLNVALKEFMNDGLNRQVDKTGLEYRQERSTAMLAHSATLAGTNNKTIYKVGQLHLDDIIQSGAAIPSDIALMNRGTYNGNEMPMLERYVKSEEL